MNTTDLENILIRQRARRNAVGSPRSQSRLRPRRDAGRVAAVVVALVMVSFIGGLGLIESYLLGIPGTGALGIDTGTFDTGALDTGTLDTETPEPLTPSPTPWTMTVCESVTWLHVRFGPGRDAEVRGYLRGGETVTLTERKGNWAFLSSPVAGWADMRYLCGGWP